MVIENKLIKMKEEMDILLLWKCYGIKDEINIKIGKVLWMLIKLNKIWILRIYFK